MKLKFVGKQSIRYIYNRKHKKYSYPTSRRLVYDVGETILYKMLCNLFSKLALLLPRYVKYCIVGSLKIIYICGFSIGMSVSLIMDDGKDTLSGSYCSTTVKLICNVTSVPKLLWTYNNGSKMDVIIFDFQPDHAITFNPITTHFSAFPLVQLTQFNVHKNQNNRSQINASTILTADLSELYNQNIRLFSCGSFGVNKSVPVNISILQPTFPSVSPQVYTAVIVRYESGLVSSVVVLWRKFQVRIVNYIYQCTIIMDCI